MDAAANAWPENYLWSGDRVEERQADIFWNVTW